MLTAMAASSILYFSTECHNSWQNIIILFCKYLADIWESGLAMFFFWIHKTKIVCSTFTHRGLILIDIIVTSGKSWMCLYLLHSSQNYSIDWLICNSRIFSSHIFGGFSASRPCRFYMTISTIFILPHMQVLPTISLWHIVNTSAVTAYQKNIARGLLASGLHLSWSS